MKTTASQVAGASIVVNLVLCLLNVAIAVASGSLAVAAEMTHNHCAAARGHPGQGTDLRVCRRRCGEPADRGNHAVRGHCGR